MTVRVLGVKVRPPRKEEVMQKNSIRFLMMSVVAAVLATGCASNKAAEADTTAGTGTGTTAMSGGQRQSSEHNVTSTSWAKVESGPVSVVGLVGVGNFEGEAECYASAGPTCGNASSAARGTRVLSCGGGRCTPENGGQVSDGQILCCGVTQGRGGKVRVSYMK
jgi:hypothetical protein